MTLADSSSETQVLPIESISLPEWQPRRCFDAEAMQELVQSIREHGILEPLLIRYLPNNTYELTAGERRLRAAQIAGLTEVPVVVKIWSDREALIVSLVENLLREDLNPLEETEAILKLLGMHLNVSIQQVISFLYRMQNDAHRLTHNIMGQWEAERVIEVFSMLGISWESFINNRLPLLKLPQDILVALRQGKIAYTKAKAIARIKDEAVRQALLETAINENLSLSQIRERIAATQARDQARDNAAVRDANSPQSLQQLMDTTYRSLKKARVWHDPEKQVELEQLLRQLQALVSEG
jgi:ParB family chromosome partitioning protein